MTVYDDRDLVMQDLARLQPLAPDPSHAERVRARCHARLERKQLRSERAALATSYARRILAPAVVGGVCVLYVAALVSTVLRVRGGLRW